MAPQASNDLKLNHDMNPTSPSTAASTAVAATATSLLNMLASKAALSASSSSSSITPETTQSYNILNLPPSFTQTTNTPLSLAPQFLAGVIPLADLPTISTRTMLTGTASYLDTLVLCPGIHKQQSADVLAGGVELPATAAMTTGYVFRTENQATVKYLQSVGVVGALVTVNVAQSATGNAQPLSALFSRNGSFLNRLKLSLQHYKPTSWSSMIYHLCPLLTLLTTLFILLIADYWALSVLALLTLSRLINITIFRARSTEGWHGVPEPGTKGDLLILLSRDRWIRLRGLVDDLKAVTSGSWLRPLTSIEGVFIGLATTMVYVAGAFAVCSSLAGSLALSVLLMGSVGLVEVSNKGIKGGMRMHGRGLEVVGQPKLYRRRLDMAKEMVREHGGRDDWAVALGMVVPDRDRIEKATM